MREWPLLPRLRSLPPRFLWFAAAALDKSDSVTETTNVRLRGSEGEYKRASVLNLRCPLVGSWVGHIWCVASTADHKVDLFSDTAAIESYSDVSTTWTYGTPDYVKYTRE